MEYDDPHHRHVRWSKTSEVKVTRPINAMTDNQPYLRNGKAYELQTWYTDGIWWPASPTWVTSKVKGQGYNVKSSVWCTCAHNLTTRSCRNTKIGKNIVRAMADILHQFQGQNVKGQGDQAALGGCSSHHLQGRAYCGSCTTSYTACFIHSYRVFHTSP